jgi:hypothetical protein
MSGIAGRGTTFDLPNYHGMLIGISPEDTPFTTAIGGLLGGIKTVASKEWEWQTSDLRAAADRQRLEGADAPAADTRVRGNVSNVLEIHQETVDVSYTKQAATGQFGGVNLGAADNPVLDEFAWQSEQAVKAKKRDIERSFTIGVYAKPADNATVRKTRGLMSSITTNVIAKSGSPNPTVKDYLDLFQAVYDAGGIQESETMTLLVGPVQKRWVTKLFVTDQGYKEETRNVGGVNLQTIETDFGKANVMLSRYMPAADVALASLEQCKPVGLEIPGKGVFFLEQLAKVGASERAQLYGEFGLEYGAEQHHGKITGFTTSAPA